MLAAKLPSTTTLIERLIALGAVACLLVGVALVLRPFVTGILFGSIIVIATWPIRDWLVRQGLSVGLTATVLLLVAVGTVGVPAIILAPGLGERLVDGIQRVQALFAGSPELPSWIAQVPWVKERVVRLWSSLAEPGGAFQVVIKPYSAELRKGIVELARAFAEGMFQFVVSLAVATMLWLRGDAAAGTLREIFERLGGSTAGSALLVAANSVRGGRLRRNRHSGDPGDRHGAWVNLGRRSRGRVARFLDPDHRAEPSRAVIGRNLGWGSLVAFWSGRHRFGHFYLCLGPARLHRGQFYSSLAGQSWRRDAVDRHLSRRSWGVHCVRVSRLVYRPNLAWRVLPIAPSLAQSPGIPKVITDAAGGQIISRDKTFQDLPRINDGCSDNSANSDLGNMTRS
jgi:hypothetical protein